MFKYKQKNIILLNSIYNLLFNIYSINVNFQNMCPYKKCKYVFSTFLILIFYVIKTNHVIRIKNTENCAITYHEKPCFVRFLYDFHTIFIQFRISFIRKLHGIIRNYVY